MTNILLSHLREKGKTHLFIDFDGTLSFLDMDWSGWRKGVDRQLEKFDPIFEHELSTLGQCELQNKYFEKFGKEAWDAMVKFTENYETKHFKGYKLSEPILEIVNDDNFVKYLWSSNSRATAMKILEKESLVDKFNKIITRDDIYFVKPNAEGFTLFYDKSYPKEKYAMIGDSDIDQRAAENAGIDFFKVAS